MKPNRALDWASGKLGPGGRLRDRALPLPGQQRRDQSASIVIRGGGSIYTGSSAWNVPRFQEALIRRSPLVGHWWPFSASEQLTDTAPSFRVRHDPVGARRLLGTAPILLVLAIAWRRSPRR